MAAGTGTPSPPLPGSGRPTIRSLHDIDTIVFDILGTLVDHDGGLRAAITALVPDADTPPTDDLLSLWHSHVASEHRRIVAGDRAYVTADVLDREAAGLVADRAGQAGRAPVDHAGLDRAAAATQHLAGWPDTAAMLERLAPRYELIGLSNADWATLLRLNAHAGLRWHVVLSSEMVRSYKPDPAVYRLAIEHAGRPPERMLMVAAHAWDLRAAAASGMHTAYLARPSADPPRPDDRFDHHLAGVDELLALLDEGVTDNQSEAPRC